MIVYQGLIKDFHQDVINGIIADRIEDGFKKHGYSHNNPAEHRAFVNSLPQLDGVFDSSFGVNQDLTVAIEFQIPLTAKRIDFIICGKDENDNKNAVIIELKQWEDIKPTNKKDLVITYVAKAYREEPHPSYQAYSYAKTIENFNETVQENNISLYPCAFLHNFKESNREKIENDRYKEIIEEAPIFLQRDRKKLADFIKKYVSKPDGGKVLYDIERGKIKPSISLQDELYKMMKGNDSFNLLDEQKVAYETILEIIRENITDNLKHTLIVQGGPGTGKSVIAIKLLSALIKEGLNTIYTSKNQAPREVYFKKLANNDYRKSYLHNLFKGSGTFVNSNENDFDCILADEAHRLMRFSGLYGNMGENQIKEIINASKVSVFFIDEDQRVTSKDIGSIEEIEYWAEKLHSKIHIGENLKLTSQFRCNGSDAYLAFLDNLLQIRPTANRTFEIDDYDIKVFDNPKVMMEELRIKNKVNNKSRMLAGYCYNWTSKKEASAYDIIIGDDFKAQRNFSNTSTWAIDENSFDQVGCIHTCQGLEFDYVGVIIGKDLIYRNGKVLTDPGARAKSDQSLKGFKNDSNHQTDCEIIIKNTYRTLLTRGQKGCYIFCEDKALSEHIKSILSLKAD